MKRKYFGGGKMDPSQQQDLAGVLGVASSIAPMFGPVGIGVGLAAGLGATALNNSAEKKMRGPHLSTFAGYVNGGSIDPLDTLISQSSVLKKLYRKPFNMPFNMPLQLPTIDSNNYQYVPISQDYMERSGPTNSKSKDRFRERANGGMIDVNSSSMEVNGNPNQVDSVYYPEKNVYLDDQEIVKGNFVYSNRITNPLSGNSFAKDSKKIESSTAKAEKRLKNSSDPISENTIKRNEASAERLAQIQEIVAEKLGKRDSQAMGYANGGPFDPLPGQQYIKVADGLSGMSYYYDPYNNRKVVRNSNGAYEQSSDTYDVPAQDAISQHLKTYPGSPARPKMEWGSIWGNDRKPTTDGYNPQPGDRYFHNQGNTSDRFQTTDRGLVDPVSGLVVKRLPDGSYAIPQGQTPNPYPKTTNNDGPVPFIPDFNPTPSPVDSVKPSPVDGVKRSPVNSVKPLPVKSWKPVPDSEWDPKMYQRDPMTYLDYPMDTIPYMKEQGVPYKSDGLSPVESMYPNQTPKLGSDPRNTIPTSIDPSNPTAPVSGYREGFTTGDYMQIAAALSRAGNFQKTEVETPNLDLTNITKNAYDVNPVLGQNNRNYQNALNNTTTSSPNLRRAIANQLYGQKLNQDSNSLEQYQQMNNQATTQYEDRLSNQRRFNAQQTGYTQDINARNRGAGMNARQAAFDQLGTVGIMLNKRKESQAYINALKVRYPDISDSVLKDILG